MLTGFRFFYAKMGAVKKRLPALAWGFILLLSQAAAAQGGNTLYGDFKVDGSQVQGNLPEVFNLILYNLSGRVIARQTITNGGRFRFFDIANGEYRLAVEVENREVARLNLHIMEVTRSDVRHDLALEWKPSFSTPNKSSDTVAVEDVYTRTPANQALFTKAQEAIKKKDYEPAIEWLKQILASDPHDHLAWTELGTVHFRREKYNDAEKAYQQALVEKPTYALALINLGKLRLVKKEFDQAVEMLARAVQAQPTSADANYFLGEAYLQVKLGSKAVVYLNEALRLDPIGKAEAHLRMAALYKAAGLKDLAVAEYEKFLAKKPDYPEKDKLQQFIRDNKKP